MTHDAQVKDIATAIEGGRTEAALEVHNQFAANTQEVTINCHDMAGYIVIAWDDEGTMHPVFHNGPRSPFSDELAGTLLAKKVEYLAYSE